MLRRIFYRGWTRANDNAMCVTEVPKVNSPMLGFASDLSHRIQRDLGYNVVNEIVSSCYGGSYTCIIVFNRSSMYHHHQCGVALEDIVREWNNHYNGSWRSIKRKTRQSLNKRGQKSRWEVSENFWVREEIRQCTKTYVELKNKSTNRKNRALCLRCKTPRSRKL